MNMFGREKRKDKKERKRLEQQEGKPGGKSATADDSNVPEKAKVGEAGAIDGTPAVDGGGAVSGKDGTRKDADGTGYDPGRVRGMLRKLQKALQRPVILSGERKFDRARRFAVEHRRAAIGLGVVGAGIASVVTGGAVAVGLAIGAASLPIADFRTFFDTGALDPKLSSRSNLRRLLGYSIWRTTPRNERWW